MRTFDISEDNDFVFDDNGNLKIVSGQDAIKNLCKQYALATRGEMIHNMDKGIPYFQTIYSERSDVFQFEAAFRARMREIEGVIAVESFDSELVDDVLKYTATIRTIYGEVEINNANL